MKYNRRVSLCHTTAIALVGWLLVSAPILTKGHQIYAAPQLPLSRWYIGGKFDSAQKCHEALEGRQKQISETRKGTDWMPIFRAENDSWANAFCISSDDPRIAKFLRHPRPAASPHPAAAAQPSPSQAAAQE